MQRVLNHRFQNDGSSGDIVAQAKAVEWLLSKPETMLSALDDSSLVGTPIWSAARAGQVNVRALGAGREEAQFLLAASMDVQVSPVAAI